MKKLLLPFCLLMLLFSLSVQAQKKQVYNDFSRWSLGVNGGISAFRGDMISFSADKTYIGGQGGLQLGYQFTPTFGLSLTTDMGQGKEVPRNGRKRLRFTRTGNLIMARNQRLVSLIITIFTPRSSISR
ncbi:MAG: hypothetical protein ACLUDU_13075 [Butyricimonas faecihominis]